MKKLLLLTIFSSLLFISYVKADFSWEYKDAYTWAFNNRITTQPTIYKANMDWEVTRIELAKMISNYAINVLKKKWDTNKKCKFNDISDKLDQKYDNWVKNACQLSLMWQWITNFRPYDKVTKAEFWTILSRLLYWNEFDVKYEAYYLWHLNQLLRVWIISNLEHPEKNEIRGNIMVMIKKSSTLDIREQKCGYYTEEWILNACNFNDYCEVNWNTIACSHVREIEPWAFNNYLDIEELSMMWCASSRDCTLADLTEIWKLKKLKVLDLWFNNFNDISPLSWLINLEKLNIDSNYVRDLSPLKNLINLKELSLDDNYVSDISPLKNLTKLEYLSIHNKYPDAKISDISILSNMVNLNTLYLGWNNISDTSALKNLKNLEDLYL